MRELAEGYADTIVASEEERAKLAEAIAQAPNLFEDAGFEQEFVNIYDTVEDVFPAGIELGQGTGLTLSSDINAHVRNPASGDDWALNQKGFTFCMSQGSPKGNDESMFYQVVSHPIGVKGGDRVLTSVYTGAHRCKIAVFVNFYKADGTYINQSGKQYNDAEAMGGQTLDSYKRLVNVNTVPEETAYVTYIWRKLDTKPGNTSSFAFFVRPMVQVVPANAGGSDVTPFKPGNAAIYPNQSKLQIKSSNYEGGKSGWAIDVDGNCEFQNGTFRGTIFADEIVGDLVSARAYTQLNDDVGNGWKDIHNGTLNVINNTGDTATVSLEAGRLRYFVWGSAFQVELGWRLLKNDELMEGTQTISTTRESTGNPANIKNMILDCPRFLDTLEVGESATYRIQRHWESGFFSNITEATRVSTGKIIAQLFRDGGAWS